MQILHAPEILQLLAGQAARDKEAVEFAGVVTDPGGEKIAAAAAQNYNTRMAETHLGGAITMTGPTFGDTLISIPHIDNTVAAPPTHTSQVHFEPQPHI